MKHKYLTFEDVAPILENQALRLEIPGDRWCGIKEAREILKRGTGEKGLFWTACLNGQIQFRREVLKDQFGNIISERKIIRYSDLQNYMNNPDEMKIKTAI